MSKPLPTLREELFRIHFRIALAAVASLFVVISVADWEMTRRLLIAGFSENVRAAAQGTATYLSVNNQVDMELHLRDFHSSPGMQALCVYDHDNMLIYDWHQEVRDTTCPSLVYRVGVERNWLEISIAQKLEENGRYIGLLYARGEVVDWTDLFVRNGAILGGMILMAYVAVCLSSRYGARETAASLAALQAQVEGLMRYDYALRKEAIPMMTREIAGLAKSIGSIHEYLLNSTMPRVQLVHLQQHYLALIGNLLASLRQNVQADSALLAQVENYELMLRLEQKSALRAPSLFNIAAVLKASIAAARAEYAEQGPVHLSATIKPAVPQQWLGQPELLGMLLKHLLLVSLRRTARGAVCMRLDVEQAGGQWQLLIKLEDSGTSLQGWQLKHWLGQAHDELMNVDEAHDVTWILSGRLFGYLGGRAHAEMGEGGGLVLTGTVPLQLVPSVVAPINPPAPMVVASQSTVPSPTQPLVMVVEAHAAMRQEMTDMFAAAGCRVFTVSKHAQAMEWAPALPCSAILLNGVMPDMGVVVARRLRHLMEEGLMEKVPLWALTTSASAAGMHAWEDAGVSQFIHLPLQQARIDALCATLPPCKGEFYHAYEPRARAELPATIIARLYELNREVASQVTTLQFMIRGLARGERPADVDQQAHAVKSAALSLGYFRLAALMSQVEHAIKTKQFSRSPAHWFIIADQLLATGFAHLNAQMSA